MIEELAVAHLQLDILPDPAGADEPGQPGGLGDGDEALARRLTSVFDLPPIRFWLAMARWCEPGDVEPRDIAPVAKRLTISFGGLDLPAARGAGQA